MLYGRHVTHAFSRGPLIKEIRFRVRASLDEIYVEVPLEQVLRTLYYSLNTFSGVAIASFTSLLPSFSLFVATNRSRLYSEELKRSSVNEVRRINNFLAIFGKRRVAETHIRTT